MDELRKRLTPEVDVRTAVWLDQNSPVLWERQAPVCEAAEGGDGESLKTVAALWVLGGLAVWCLGLWQLAPFGVSRETPLHAILYGEGGNIAIAVCGCKLDETLRWVSARLAEVVGGVTFLLWLLLSPLLAILPPLLDVQDGLGVLGRASADPAGLIALATAAAGALHLTVGVQILLWWVIPRQERRAEALKNYQCYGY